MGVTYKKNVFINCPFDKDYTKIFNGIIFTIIDCGYNPRCCLEIGDSIVNRLDKIHTLIDGCCLSIHDISRTELDKKYNLPRFNMPFELGLFFGARHFGQSRHRKKSCLILESKQYSYQKFLSDIAGNDIHAHKNNYKLAIKSVCQWLQLQTNKSIILLDYKILLSRYVKFEKAKPNICKKINLSPLDLQFTTYCSVVNYWIKFNSLTNNHLANKF